MSGRRKLWLGSLAVALATVAVLGVKTRANLVAPPDSLREITARASALQLLARDGTPLNLTFENAWNVHDLAALHEIPAFLRLAFIHAEDKRFYAHGGPDWRARLSAAVTNVRSLRALRGASTISEQVVRLLHPRPRTVWTRWLEGFEAARLERTFTKDEILEFYLNQVPYAANRRGVRQAASYYFARDLETLSRKEMLALAVLVRSPSRLDLRRSLAASDAAILRLAATLVERGVITSAERDRLLAQDLPLEASDLDVTAPHFLRYAQGVLGEHERSLPRVVTTLDARLQRDVQRMLDQRLAWLAPQRVADGAVLVVENATREVLVWAVAGGANAMAPQTHVDAVTTPRQPGSALKPFLYALALDSGWTAADLIDDAPLAAEVGNGLHSYRNYSGSFYGPVTLRDALANSLNIPALKTLRFVGAERYLATLHALGFTGLDRRPEVYGDGIALGNGEVSLLDLVQGYVTLANAGVFAPLEVVRQADTVAVPRAVYTPEAASLIADILSDPEARALEFGRHSVLGLPSQTAVKTGTSSDFHDAWIVGFDARFTVGVWLGNLDRTPTQGLTGSTGPALLMRSVFAELTRGADAEPLYLSRKLQRRNVCVPAPAQPADRCMHRAEWFLSDRAPGLEDAANAKHVAAGAAQRIRLRRPTAGLQLALDPRLPDAAQAFEFVVDGTLPTDSVLWTVDGMTLAGRNERYLWPLARGRHRVGVSVLRDGVIIAEQADVDLVVK